MPTVRAIAESIASITNPELTPSWDPVGIQLGDPEAEVRSVAVCHEVTEGVVSRVEESPVDLLISYHPLLFSPTNRVLAGRSPGSRSYRLIRTGVNLLVTHTDFDSAPGGTADALAAFFGLRDVSEFGEDPDTGLPSIGRVGAFEGTLGRVDAMVVDAFGPTGLRVTGDREATVGRLAVVPGSGSAFIEAAAEAAADALVTGDVSHHRTVAAADLGLAVVDPGHTATERPGMEALTRMVAEVADVEVVDLTHLDPRTWH
ncbi:MAG TPA: Nif3-like dinuclear metal center hexameric protein [Acidimicrobiia bacterium]|nr:Nif3-like dinuclear metal center hexameric protein [Acidimicrobiia bacterium]